MAIGVARRGARRSGERTLRIPPSCSFPVSHACGPHVASFVRRSSVCALASVRACGRAWRAAQCEASRKKEQEKGAVRAARPPRAVGAACEVLHEREKRGVRAVVQRGPRGAGSARVELPYKPAKQSKTAQTASRDANFIVCLVAVLSLHHRPSLTATTQPAASALARPTKGRACAKI